MKQKVWMIRPNPSSKSDSCMREFLDEGIVAIGYESAGSFAGKNKEQIKEALEVPMLGRSAGQLGAAVATVNRFVNEFHTGDIVVLPQGNDIYFCRVESDYYFVKEKIFEGYANQRQVTFLKGPVSRGSIPVALRLSLRAPMALADLSHHADEILNYLNGTTVIQSNDEEKTSLFSNDDYVVFDYPIDLDTKAQVRIPKSINKEQSERFSEFVRTLHFN